MAGSRDRVKKAIELKPSYATAYQWYGLFLWNAGRYEEAMERTERANELDPLSRVIGLNLGLELLTLGKRDQAIERFRKVIKLDPDFPMAHSFLSLAYLEDSGSQDAISEAEKASLLSKKGDLFIRSLVGFVYGICGRNEQANEILNELKDAVKNKYVSSVWVATLLFSLERSDEGFEYLDKALEERSNELSYFRNSPSLEKFRADPRWASLEKRIGLWKS